MNDPRTVRLELSSDELSLLELHLRRHLDSMDRELIRTEKRELQHAIAREVAQLERLLTRIQRTITSADTSGVSEAPTVWPRS